MRGAGTGKEEEKIKPLLFADDKIMCMENNQTSKENCYEKRTIECTKVTYCKIRI